MNRWRVGDADALEQSCLALLQALVSLPGLLAGGVLAVAVVFSPGAIARGEHFAWTGFVRAPCGGCSLCGMSRALSSLAHGDWTSAWALHPGAFVLGPLLTLLVVASGWGVYRLWRDPPRFFTTRRYYRSRSL